MTLILPLGVAPSPVPLLTAATVARPDRGTRRAELVRVMRGVYAPAQAWRELAPWERYVARVHAASIVHPDAVFILESAAALLGLPIFGEPQHVHVLLPEPASSRAFSGVQIHTRERMPALELRDGLRVATACETVVEMARLRHPAVALALAGMALRADPALAHADLRRTSAAIPTSRGAKRAKWVFDRASGVPESTLEHVSLAAIEWLGFDAPTLQHWVRGAGAGDDDRLDFCWEYERIGGEADGDVKYSGDYGDAVSYTHLRAHET